ncbi:MAG: butyrate kinase [Spirochaetales bacterium]|nr:butyrate kinase [Spirochaetales bacterium]
MSLTVLAVNPGSTSTKAALFRDGEIAEEINCPHDAADLEACGGLFDQKKLRLKVLAPLLKEGIKLDAVIGRGGLMKPLDGGVYRVNRAMLEDLESCRYGTHASNLGGVLAAELARRFGRTADCPALIADPVVVDEMIPEAHVSGIDGIPRRSIFHALNQKSTAREAAKQLGLDYENANFIVAHMGGGISVGAHRTGRVIDVNNALDGDGPFSPERSGTVPAGQLLDLVESGRPIAEIRRLLTGAGGAASLYGSKDIQALLDDCTRGVERARIIYGAMILQISQEIARHGATLEGRVDAVVLTGGMAQSSTITDDIERKISYLAPVIVIPGEREMHSLADNAYAALKGTREIREYTR